MKLASRKRQVSRDGECIQFARREIRSKLTSIRLSSMKAGRYEEELDRGAFTIVGFTANIIAAFGPPSSGTGGLFVRLHMKLPL